MILRQVIKLDKPFKRSGDRMWILWGRPESEYRFSIEDVLADDWECRNDEDRRLKVGDEVRIYDRYRLSNHEVFGRVIKFSSSNDGVQIQVKDAYLYLLGQKKSDEYWVSENQCFLKDEIVSKPVS